MVAARGRRTALSFTALVLAVVILELAISSATSSGFFGVGNGLVRPFPPTLARIAITEKTGEVLVEARLTKLCAGPSNQGTEGSWNVPVGNLSVSLTSVSGAQLFLNLVTNSSGFAETRLQVGTYNVVVRDARVNRSATLQVVEGKNVLNFTSKEHWFFASFFDIQSASASGRPEPWANLTATFPELFNATVGSHVVLASGTLPRCPVLGAPTGQPSWTNATVLSLERRSGVTWVTYKLAGAPRSAPESLSEIAYSSTYGESSND